MTGEESDMSDTTEMTQDVTVEKIYKLVDDNIIFTQDTCMCTLCPLVPIEHCKCCKAEANIKAACEDENVSCVIKLKKIDKLWNKVGTDLYKKSLPNLIFPGNSGHNALCL